MSKSWREWGRERQERSLKKSFDKWESEFEDMAEIEGHESVFIVVNEWEGTDDSDLSEIVALYHTENAAWDELSEIASEFGVDLGPDDTSFAVPRGNFGPNETYYIEERQYND